MKFTTIELNNTPVLIVSDDGKFENAYAPEYLALSPEGYLYGWADDADEAIDNAVFAWEEKLPGEDIPEFKSIENGSEGFDL